jgi:hypothetical protein
MPPLFLHNPEISHISHGFLGTIMEECTIALNNRAVELLREHGNLSTASSLLQRALEVMRDVSDATPLDAKEHRMPSIMRSFAEVVGTPASAVPYKGLDDSIYLHTQGITLAGLFTYSPDPLLNVSIVSSIILYNLALIGQLKGLQQGSFGLRQRYTKRASSLYAKTRSILARVGITSECATGLAVLDFLCLALGNNEAHAAYMEGNYAVSQASLQHVEALVLSLDSVQLAWDGETVVLMDRFIQMFLRNAMFLRTPLVAASA